MASWRRSGACYCIWLRGVTRVAIGHAAKKRGLCATGCLGVRDPAAEIDRTAFEAQDRTSKYAQSLSQCRSAQTVAKPKTPPPPRSACTCEDWGRDGRFGVVLNGKTVLAPNVGSVESCKARAQAFSQCR